MFVAGTMHTLLKQGREVHGVWVTSGDARGAAHTRETELKSAMQIVGLEQIHLLKLRNGGLLDILDRAVDLVAGKIDLIRPDCITATAYEGGHIDHDAVNLITIRAAQRSAVDARLFEFPLYNRNGPFYTFWWNINRFPNDSGDTQYVRLTRNALKVKHRAMWAYASQLRDMIPFRLTLGRRRLMSLGEPYRPIAGDRDFSLAPHSGRLNYERSLNSSHNFRFSDFQRGGGHFTPTCS